MKHSWTSYLANPAGTIIAGSPVEKRLKNTAALHLRAIGPPHIDNTMDSLARFHEYEAQPDQLHCQFGRDDNRGFAVEKRLEKPRSFFVKTAEAEVFHFQVFFNPVF